LEDEDDDGGGGDDDADDADDEDGEKDGDDAGRDDDDDDDDDGAGDAAVAKNEPRPAAAFCSCPERVVKKVHDSESSTARMHVCAGNDPSMVASTRWTSGGDESFTGG